MSSSSKVMLLFVLMFAETTFAGAPYYYGGGKQIPLRIDSTRITVKLDPSLSPAQQDGLIRKVGRIDKALADSVLIDGFVSYSLKEVDGLDSFVDSLRLLDGFVSVEPYYRTLGGYPLLVGDRFCVGFNTEMTKSEIDSVNGALGSDLAYEIEGMPNVWVLRNTKRSLTGTLELANHCYGLPVCYFAQPIFGARPQPSSYKLYDHYNAYQPHIKRVIGSFNDKSVWDFAGLTESATVAVIDWKVETHEDLPASRILPGRDYVPREVYASVVPYDTAHILDWHGIACAGLIAASHTTDSASGGSDSSGMISMNPRVKILPVTIFGPSYTPSIDTLAAAITYAWQHGADILSCSWCFLNDRTIHFDPIDAAIHNAHIYGRVRGSDTLGCAIFFASGNQMVDTVAYPGSLDECVAVGAVHPENDTVRWYYSQYGEKLDLVAPSGESGGYDGVFTLDLMGTRGMNSDGGGTFSLCGIAPNNVNYSCQFEGTSAACPIAVGVASLLLSRDPTLRAGLNADSGRIENILLRSAVPPPPGIYPPYQFGAGRVDAFRAILAISHGDASNDNVIDISDVFAVIDYLWSSVPLFPSELLGDANCSGVVDIADVTYLIDYLSGGDAPIKPCYAF